jgi:acetyl esterase/lipase
MPATYEIDTEDVEYLRHGDRPLLARIYRPRGVGPFPAVVEAHGGAWVSGTRLNNASIDEPLARRGVVVMAVDFRNPPEASYPASVADINFAVRWLKVHAETYGSRPGLVGTLGTSSGAHLAVLVAMKPDDPRYAAIPLPGVGTALDARVPYVVALWPVISPIGRYRHMEALRASDQPYPAQLAQLASQQREYWLTEEAMADGAPALTLERGERVALPRMLYIQHVADPLHPRADLEQFVAAYRKADGQLELEFFDGPAYDVIRTDPSSPTSVAAIERIAEFIHKEAR